MNQTISKAFARMIDQMPGACGCKNEHSVFICANEEFKAIAGLRSGDCIVGMTDFDLPGEMAFHAKTFQEQDRYVLENQVPITTFNVYRMKCARINAYLVNKKPFFDQEAQARGILMHLTDMSALNVGLLGPYHQESGRVFGGHRSPLGVSYVIAGGDTDLDITRREYEVLFFLLRGATAKRIGQFLSISSRTVEQYVTILKEKFEVLTKQELIEKAILMGYYYVMPDSVLRVVRSDVGEVRSVLRGRAHAPVIV
ncbi:PAS and helix-turn-helix domain-containing protein [Dyella sp. GSA-30]|uniref:PAS and helix-turn-helix domain-containing protein n=1 Tax=Dyella sp. GSA-30 TaxID=2994496 RepID=UPI0024925D2C|nr:PAS and helix-turn-helix domain-containing protein [Dyella sp. GSA-30]BDU21164.1 LuxR family transcriptional regulator [Dyella sp. GSA-30]